MKKVAVIGRGVIGLTTALYLSQQGIKVYLFSSSQRRRTSESAAAFWYPFAVEQSVDQERQLAWPTLQFYRQHQFEAVKTTVAHQFFDETVGREQRVQPWWMKDKTYGANFRRIAKNRIPLVDDSIGPIAEGWRFEIPVIEVGRFLVSLEKQVQNAGVEFDERIVNRFAEFLDGQFDAVVNCTGAWAAQLTQDAKLFGLQGIVIDAPLQFGGNTLKFLEHGKCSTRPVYVVPNSQRLVLGGTLERVTGNGERLRENDPRAWHATDEEILKVLDRCRMIEPKLKDWNPSIEELRSRTRVAPRPVRESEPPRICPDTNHDNPKVIHNYGHGGSGFTMFWGAAIRVHELLQSFDQPLDEKESHVAKSHRS
jgi:D-amino-acid oxidase